MPRRKGLRGLQNSRIRVGKRHKNFPKEPRRDRKPRGASRGRGKARRGRKRPRSFFLQHLSFEPGSSPKVGERPKTGISRVGDRKSRETGRNEPISSAPVFFLCARRFPSSGVSGSRNRRDSGSGFDDDAGLSAAVAGFPLAFSADFRRFRRRPAAPFASGILGKGPTRGLPFFETPVPEIAALKAKNELFRPKTLLRALSRRGGRGGAGLNFGVRSEGRSRSRNPRGAPSRGLGRHGNFCGLGLPLKCVTSPAKRSYILNSLKKRVKFCRDLI